jgi:hypothetical protein
MLMCLANHEGVECTYLSEIQFATAVTLIEESHSRRQVALILNVNRGTINRAWIRYQIHGIVRRQLYTPRARATP